MNTKFVASLMTPLNASLLLCLFLSSSCATFRKQEQQKPVVVLHLDTSWRCANDKESVVCRPTDNQSELIKVIAWTARPAGPSDTIANYHEKLKQPRKVRKNLRKIWSTSLSDETITINGQPWVDALQANSDIAGFNTRYLATVKNGLAITVTFSARKDIFDDFQKEIQPVIDHIEINAPPATPEN